jgi:hypothetical protein
LASNTKRSSHPEAAAEEDRMEEGDRTVWWSWSWIVMIKMISEISKSSVQGIDIVLKLSLLIV